MFRFSRRHTLVVRKLRCNSAHSIILYTPVTRQTTLTTHACRHCHTHGWTDRHACLSPAGSTRPQAHTPADMYADVHTDSDRHCQEGRQAGTVRHHAARHKQAATHAHMHARTRALAHIRALRLTHCAQDEQAGWVKGHVRKVRLCPCCRN